MTFGTSPTDNLNTPLGSVYVPGTANSDLTVLEGYGPINTDANGQKSSGVSMGMKDGNNASFGAKADTVATTDTGTFTYMQLFKRLLQKFPSIGTNTKANSVSVTIATDQGNIATSAADGAVTSIGATTDTSATTDTGTFSLLALVKRLLAKFANDSTDRIKVSLYGQNAAAGDTALAVNASGVVKTVAQASGGTNLGNVGLIPLTSGGTSNTHLVSASSINATVAKNAGGQVYGYEIFNAAASVRFVKLYNKATAPAPATDSALLLRTIAIPAGTSRTANFPNGLGGYTAGIAFATVTGIADTDATAVTANDLVIDIDWK